MPEIDQPLPRVDGDHDAWLQRFDLLADPTRLKLLTQIHLHPDSRVGELAEACGVTPTATSQALRVLRDQGWVEAHQQGRTVHYRLVDGAVHTVLHLMGQNHDH